MSAKSSRVTALRMEETRGSNDRAGGVEASILSADALDDRIAILGTAGSGKTYAAKGFVERLLDARARVAVVDPLGVWWGLRASADGAVPGYPVVVFGGRHADVAITAEMGTALGRLIAGQALVCVVISRRSVRRGRVRGFIPWLITQRPAVVHKDVLSQADILIAMKLTASQDRDAIGASIEGQADRQEGKRIPLPRSKEAGSPHRHHPVQRGGQALSITHI